MNAALLIFLAVAAGAVLVLVVAGVRALLRRESVKDCMYTAACPDGTMAGHGPWPGRPMPCRRWQRFSRDGR
ncbi:hypothetical protein BH20ACT18_BH20ACT18_05640 [soil metagenome]